MKRAKMTVSLKAKLIMEIALSLILTIIFLDVLSVFIMAPFIQNNQDILQEPTINYFIIAVIISVIAFFVVCFLMLFNRHIRYIKYITKEVKLVANGDLSVTLQVKGHDELAELCKNINSMTIELNHKFEHERDLERTKTELITNVSHDLRTPLTPIIAYLDILRNGKYKTKEEEKEYLNSSYNLSLKLKKLIDELFEYTKLSGDKGVISPIVVDICPILRQLIGEYAPMLEDKGLTVISQILDAEIPVKIDVEKMVRVFDNILSNAEKYSDKPSDILVKADIIGNEAVMSISNKGGKLDRDQLNKMFDKFYRTDTSRSSTIEGSGLGLAICKRIIELHSGRIWAECEGEMIIMVISLPIIL